MATFTDQRKLEMYRFFLVAFDAFCCCAFALVRLSWNRCPYPHGITTQLRLDNAALT
jgi:hypothetical protein